MALVRSIQAIPARYRIPVILVAAAAWLSVVVGAPYLLGLRGWGLLFMSVLGALFVAVSFIPFHEE